MAQKKSKSKRVNKDEIIDATLRKTATLMIIIPISIIFVMVSVAWVIVAIGSGSIPDHEVLVSIFKYAFDFLALFLNTSSG